MIEENTPKFKEKYSQALEEHLRFEELLGLLSSKLVNLPFESIDDEIEESMKLLAEFFHVDRCHVGKLGTKESKIEVSHYYANPNVTIPQITSIGENSYSYLYNSINNGEKVVFSLPEELPNEATEDREAFIKSGIKSLLVIPLFVDNGRRLGAVALFKPIGL